MKAVLITPDGELASLEPKNKINFTLAEAQKAVGGDIKILNIGPDRIMVLDEEGRLKNLPPNPRASKIAGRYIVGTVFTCHTDMIR